MRGWLIITANDCNMTRIYDHLVRLTYDHLVLSYVIFINHSKEFLEIQEIAKCRFTLNMQSHDKNTYRLEPVPM